MHHTDAEELARARLAFVSAGQRPLSAPRRAVADPAPEAEHPLPAVEQPAARAWPKLTLKHLAVIAALLMCGVGVAVTALARSAATEIPLPPVTVTEAAPAPVLPTPVPMLRVHVAGAVRQPGVVRLPEGTIVEDAILAAGGLLEGADAAQLNLAASVTDGMQVVIGTVEEPLGEVVGGEAASATASGGAGPVNLNTATQAELELLPGVGPVMAQAIMAWREQHGAFGAVEELQEISGVGPKTFQKLQPLVTT